MRTTVDAVRAIITTDVTDPVLLVIIQSANIWLESLLQASNLSNELRAQIEMWVSAHMVASTHTRLATKEGAGGAFIEYAGTFGVGLNSTSYGQTAMMLDTSGILTKAGKSQIQMIAL